MPSIDSLNALLIDELRDLYDAEKRLTRAIPKLMRKADNEELKEALEEHLHETQEQVARLEDAFAHLDMRPRAKACAGMRGIIEEGDEHLSEEYENDALRDATIIGAAQRVEHYEIAAYGTAIAHARVLGHDKIVRLLTETLEEEKAADTKLSEIAETVVNLDAAQADTEEAEEELAAVGAETRRRSGRSR